MEYRCPRDGAVLEFTSGDFYTGVTAPDGSREQKYEEGFFCEECGNTYSESDVVTDIPDESLA